MKTGLLYLIHMISQVCWLKTIVWPTIFLSESKSIDMQSLYKKEAMQRLIWKDGPLLNMTLQIKNCLRCLGFRMVFQSWQRCVLEKVGKKFIKKILRLTQPITWKRPELSWNWFIQRRRGSSKWKSKTRGTSPNYCKWPKLSKTFREKISELSTWKSF